jgi:hypothetical protein
MKDGEPKIAEHSEFNGFKMIKVFYSNASKRASMGRLRFDDYE